MRRCDSAVLATGLAGSQGDQMLHPRGQGNDEPADLGSHHPLQGALTYVQQLARSREFTWKHMLLNALHFMMLHHGLRKWPGRFRPGDIHTDGAHTRRRVYTGPDADDVPSLISELIGHPRRRRRPQREHPRRAHPRRRRHRLPAGLHLPRRRRARTAGADDVRATGCRGDEHRGVHDVDVQGETGDPAQGPQQWTSGDAAVGAGHVEQHAIGYLDRASGSIRSRLPRASALKRYRGCIGKFPVDADRCRERPLREVATLRPL